MPGMATLDKAGLEDIMMQVRQYGVMLHLRMNKNYKMHLGIGSGPAVLSAGAAQLHWSPRVSHRPCVRRRMYPTFLLQRHAELSICLYACS